MASTVAVHVRLARQGSVLQPNRSAQLVGDDVPVGYESFTPDHTNAADSHDRPRSGGHITWTTTRGSPSPAPSRQVTVCLPLTTWLAARVEASTAVPAFTSCRSTGWVPSSSPAASPRLRRRLLPWPPGRRTQDRHGVARRQQRPRVRTADPAQIHQGFELAFQRDFHWPIKSRSS